MKLSSFGSLCGRSIAFTMAEILLSLTIIGVVAAITLPSLTGNINERTWNTQRKALLARMSQSIGLMPQIRGYGHINVSGNNVQDMYGGLSGASYNSDDATEAFLSAGLSKVYKLNNICDSAHISDCGMPNEVINFVGSKVNISEMTDLYAFSDAYKSEMGCGSALAINSKAAAFESQNGESFLVYYNPVCKDFDTVQYSMNYFHPKDFVCINYIFDLNGKKGPNTMGKDVGFMSVVYPSNSIIVAPLPALKNASESVTFLNAPATCTAQGDYRMPNKEELMSLSVNAKFIGNFDTGYISSSPATKPTVTSSDYYDKYDFVWGISSGHYQVGGEMDRFPKTEAAKVRCIKR